MSRLVCAALVGALLLVSTASTQAQTKRMSTFRVLDGKTRQWRSTVGVQVKLPARVSRALWRGWIRVPRRLPHGLGESGNLPKRLPHGLGRSGNLPRRLPHGLGRTGNLPKQLPHGLGQTGNRPVSLPHGLGPAGNLPLRLF